MDREQNQHISTSLDSDFETFSRVSQQLEHSYRSLEGQVSHLSGQLDEARLEQTRQLHEKEQLASRLQELLAVLPAGVLVLDAELQVVECNSAAVELLDYSPLAQSWQEVIDKTMTSADQNRQQATLKNGKIVSLSVSRTADGSQIIVLNDITENQRLNGLVTRQQRLYAMGEVAARLAHQIRTPLASLMLYVSHLQRPHCDGPLRLRVAGKMIERLRHMERQINDMLVYARGGNAGEESIPVRSLLEEAVQSLEVQITRGGHTFRLEGVDSSHHVHGNRQALLGVLTNLLMNSMEACEEHCHMALSVNSDEEGHIVIALSDNGPGILSEVREQIFEPFFTTRSDGTGLGLAVVKAVVQAHEGDVQCISAPGAGTTFKIRLPLVESPDQRAVA